MPEAGKPPLRKPYEPPPGKTTLPKVDHSAYRIQRTEAGPADRRRAELAEQGFVLERKIGIEIWRGPDGKLLAIDPLTGEDVKAGA